MLSPFPSLLTLGLLLVLPCTSLCAEDPPSYFGTAIPPAQKIVIRMRVDDAFAILKDDNADPERWVTAAKIIVLPPYPPNSPGGSLSSPIPPTGISSTGEELRSQANPSVSDLLIKRMNSTFLLAPLPDQMLSRVLEATLLAEALADWDGKNHLAELRDFCNRLAHVQVSSEEYAPVLAKEFLDVVAKRVDLQDQSAVKTLVDFLSSDRFPRSNLNILAYLWQRPNNALLAVTADQFFTDKSDGWGPVLELNLQFAQSINSPLLGVSYFRKALIVGLKETDVVLQPRPTEISDLVAHYGLKYKMGDNMVDLPIDLRACDIYAMGIAAITEAPPFDPAWPTSQKDLAIDKITAFLNQYGNAYQYRGADAPTDSYHQYQPVIPISAKFQLDQLDHPATAADVQAGKAIFTLTGPSSAKVVTLYHLPVTISKTDPAVGHPVTLQVWQAESVVDEHGISHNYYGYTADHDMGKCDESTLDAGALALLAAAKLMPPVPGSTSDNTDTPPLELLWPVAASVNGAVDSLKRDYGAKTPILINFKLRNYTQQAVPVPPGFSPTTDQKTLPIGFSLEEKVITVNAPDLTQTQQTSTVTWTSLHMKPQSPSVFLPSPPPATPPTIPASGEYELGCFDLTTLYDLSNPGDYRLKIGNPKSDTGITILFSIKVTPPAP